jgi:hypothetical protein
MMKKFCLLLAMGIILPEIVRADDPELQIVPVKPVYDSRARVEKSRFRSGTMTTVVGRMKKSLPKTEEKAGRRKQGPVQGDEQHTGKAAVPEKKKELKKTKRKNASTRPARVSRRRVFIKCKEGPDSLDPDCMYKPRSLRQKQWEQFQLRHGR